MSNTRADAVRRILDLARAQHGVVTSVQANDLGLTSRMLAGLQGNGHLERIHRGVYRVSGSPRTWEQRLAGAVLASGGVGSHRSAARLHGLTDRAPLEVTVPHGTRRGAEMAGVTRYRSRHLPPASSAKGIAATSVERTLMDLAWLLPAPRLEATLDRALHHGLVVPAEVLGELDRAGSRGRPGAAVLRGLLIERIDGSVAPTESELEVRVLATLRRFGVPEPTRQLEVMVSGCRYRLDLAWPASMVCLEADGRAHDEGRRFEADRIRQNRLVAAGWRVLRCTWRMAVDRPHALATMVHDALR